MDIGSVGSVKSIVVMFELLFIGGGGRVVRRFSEGYFTFRFVSLELGRVVTVLVLVKYKEVIGFDGEVVNRRRTFSGFVIGFLVIVRRGFGESAGFVDYGYFVEDGVVR